MIRIATVLLALFLAGIAPAAAEPNAQLVRSVQQRLDTLGFRDVDAGTLSTPQIGALHLQLNGDALDIGTNYIETRQKVKVILGWTREDEQRY